MSTTLAGEIVAYLEAQRVGRQAKGIRTYGYALRQLEAYAAGQPLDAQLVAAWLSSRADLAPATTRATIAVVSSFDEWRRRYDPQAPDLLALVTRPRKTPSEPIQAPVAEILKLAAWIESEDACPRSARFCALCLYAGLRITEARLLLWDAIDELAMELVVRGETAKFHKPRRLPIAPPLARLFAAVPRRERIGAVAGLHDGQPLSQGGAEKIFERELPRLGIHVSAHMLRRAFATRLDEIGVSVRVIQELLGHSSLETTQRYLGVDRRRLRDAVDGLDGAFGG